MNDSQFGIKREKTVKNKLIVFASNSLESKGNRSHHSFFKSNKGDLLKSLFCKEGHERITDGRSLK